MGLRDVRWRWASEQEHRRGTKSELGQTRHCTIEYVVATHRYEGHNIQTDLDHLATIKRGKLPIFFLLRASSTSTPQHHSQNAQAQAFIPSKINQISKNKMQIKSFVRPHSLQHRNLRLIEFQLITAAFAGFVAAAPTPDDTQPATPSYSDFLEEALPLGSSTAAEDRDNTLQRRACPGGNIWNCISSMGQVCVWGCALHGRKNFQCLNKCPAQTQSQCQAWCN